jgi:hypothetical protein
MIVKRRLGDRLEIKTRNVGRLRERTHTLLEADLKKAWSKVVRYSDPRLLNPLFGPMGDGWCVKSSLTGELLATIRLVPQPKGRPRP